MAWKPTQYQIGDRHADIAAAKDRLRRIAATLTAGRLDGDTSDEFTPAFAEVYAEWLAAVHRDVLSGRRPSPDVDPAQTSIDWAAKVQLGLIQRAAPPAAPPAPRLPAICFRGTGGVIGLDYVSRICQMLGGLVEEIHPRFTATMGGIPVGAAVDLGGQSMNDAVDEAVADAQRIFLERIAADPTMKIVIIGYSAGAVAAARFRQWVLDNFGGNYLCSVSIGDPTRPDGGGYYPGVAAPGHGISSWRYGNIRDWRHIWLTDPFDMYGAIPGGVVGDIMDDCFDYVTAFALTDPLGAAGAILPRIPATMDKLGLPIPKILGALTDGVIGSGLIGIGVPLLISGISGLIPTGRDPATLTGMAAGAHAAMIAIRFVTSNPPTAAHIQYEFREVWPGQTYLGLAAQHIRDWAGREPVRN